MNQGIYSPYRVTISSTFHQAPATNLGSTIVGPQTPIRQAVVARAGPHVLQSPGVFLPTSPLPFTPIPSAGTHQQYYYGIAPNISVYLTPPHPMPSGSVLSQSLLYTDAAEPPQTPKKAGDTHSVVESSSDHFIIDDDFIRMMNSTHGSSQNEERVRLLIERMRRCGGLNDLNPGEKVDIPDARIGLCKLLAIKQDKNRKYALESLLEILKRGGSDMSSAYQLIDMTTMFINQMSKDRAHTHTVDIQILIAQIYDQLAAKLYLHFRRKHLIGVTEAFKKELLENIDELLRLNRTGHRAIKFHLGCAYESAKCIEDDNVELYEFVENLYKAVIDEKQRQSALINILTGIDFSIKRSWFKGASIIRKIARMAKSNMDCLHSTQYLIQQKYRKLNWKFTFAAMEVLNDHCMRSDDPKIQMQALLGSQTQNGVSPGLAYFLTVRDIPLYINFNEIANFRIPRTVDPNIAVKCQAAEYIKKLSESAPDPDVQAKAKALIQERLKVEGDIDVKNSLLGIHPQGSPIVLKKVGTNNIVVLV